MGYVSTCSWYALLALISLVAAAACYFIYAVFILPLSNPMFKLSGPKSYGLFKTQLGIIMNANATAQNNEKLIKKYGKTMKIDALGSWHPRLYTLDHRALTYVLNNSTKYPKPWQSQRVIGNLIGYGMLATEGAAHRTQKKIITPAFSPANLKDFLPVFFDKAKELQSRWGDLIDAQQGKESGGADIDVCHWMSRATFDIIGLAGFEYTFDAIKNEENPVYLAYKRMFGVIMDHDRGLVKDMISVYCPSFDKIFPDEAIKVVATSHKVIYTTARELVERKRQAVLKEMEDGNHDEPAKDLLSRLLRSNLSADIPENQRLSDESLMDNINTTLFAGSDTTSLGLAWTLFLLATHPDQQTALREELVALQAAVTDPSDPSIFSMLDELPKLNNVIRESLRVIPPVHSSLRVAMEDDVIPTAEPIHLRDGSLSNDGIHIKKGTFVHIAIEGMNMLRDVWGDDAHDFNPERWENLPEAVKLSPGIYGPMMTFSHGPRACIGVRFSVMVMKVFLYFMITSYQFESTVPILKGNRIMIRPYPNGEWDDPSRLPLKVTRLHA